LKDALKNKTGNNWYDKLVKKQQLGNHVTLDFPKKHFILDDKIISFEKKGC
jgi:hypothetical protein